MTEEEWLSSPDPTPMLEFLRGKASDRKLRLFAVACCLRVRHLIRNDGVFDALRASEQFADGIIDQEEMRLRRVERRYAVNSAHPPTQAVAAASHERRVQPEETSRLVADSVADTEAAMGNWNAVRAREQLGQCVLIRDIFGNPFRPVTPDPSWITSTVTTLARQMYDTRDFSAMPIMADALQDAGCGDEQVLSHCRGEGVHVRGCWLVDLLTERE